MIDDWPGDSWAWCDNAFGPPFVDDAGVTIPAAYQCRLQKGHTGPHDCPAAQEAGYIDCIPPDLNDPVAIEQFLGER